MSRYRGQLRLNNANTPAAVTHKPAAHSGKPAIMNSGLVDADPGKTDCDQQVFQGHQPSSLLRLGLHVQFRRRRRRNTETKRGKASPPSAGRRRRTNCRHPLPDARPASSDSWETGRLKKTSESRFLASGMSRTRKSIISGTPPTNGSCSNPALWLVEYPVSSLNPIRCDHHDLVWHI